MIRIYFVNDAKTMIIIYLVVIKVNLLLSQRIVGK